VSWLIALQLRINYSEKKITNKASFARRNQSLFLQQIRLVFNWGGTSDKCKPFLQYQFKLPGQSLVVLQYVIIFEQVPMVDSMDCSFSGRVGENQDVDNKSISDQILTIILFQLSITFEE
jgi:hypothetical protein